VVFLVDNLWIAIGLFSLFSFYFASFGFLLFFCDISLFYPQNDTHSSFEK